jgi:hypothetical protein
MVRAIPQQISVGSAATMAALTMTLAKLLAVISGTLAAIPAKAAMKVTTKMIPRVLIFRIPCVRRWRW